MSEEASFLKVGEGPKGRGLFAIKDIPPRTLIHVAHCILVTKEEYDKHMQFTVLEHYLFNDSGGNKLLALGYGSLFNHARHPNVDYRVDSKKKQIVYNSGHKPIRTGEELCITYGGNLWFDDADGSVDDSVSSEESTGDRIANFLGRIELADNDDDDSR